MSAKTDTFYENLTAKVIALIEASDDSGWAKPWASIFGAMGLPTNAKTKKQYQGGNVWALWFEAADRGYDTPIWGTYKQFEALGGQVRKGETGTHLIKWVITYRCQTCGMKSSRGSCPRPGHESTRSMFPSVFSVFNLAQQDGYEAPEVKALDEMTEPERIAQVEEFIAATGASIRHAAGDRAYYKPGTNDITLPAREQFETTAGYYGTCLHELTHWSGDESRLDRQQKNTFGSLKYAAEELVAEFGGIFLAAHFGIETSGHAESAKYMRNWLETLRADSKNLYKAASQAQKAVDFMLTLAAEKVSEAA